MANLILAITGLILLPFLLCILFLCGWIACVGLWNSLFIRTFGFLFGPLLFWAQLDLLRDRIAGKQWVNQRWKTILARRDAGFEILLILFSYVFCAMYPGRFTLSFLIIMIFNALMKKRTPLHQLKSQNKLTPCS